MRQGCGRRLTQEAGASVRYSGQVAREPIGVPGSQPGSRSGKLWVGLCKGCGQENSGGRPKQISPKADNALATLFDRKRCV
jgi:hypothetical protein